MLILKSAELDSSLWKPCFLRWALLAGQTGHRSPGFLCKLSPDGPFWPFSTPELEVSAHLLVVSDFS